MVGQGEVNEDPYAVAELCCGVFEKAIGRIHKQGEVLNPWSHILQTVDPLRNGGLVHTCSDFIDEIEGQVGCEQSQLLAQLRHERSRMSRYKHSYEAFNSESRRTMTWTYS